MICSKCSAKVGVFSPEWQSQRELTGRRCPACGASVEVVFGAKTFGTWVLGSAAIIAAVMLVFDAPWSLAVFNGLLFGTLIAFFPSMELRPVAERNTGIRAALNRRIELPSWLEPPPALRASARAIWAVGSYLVLLAAITLNIPPPWSGALLLFMGAIGLSKPSPNLNKFQVTALRVGAIGLLFLGVILFVHHYA